MMEAVVCHPLGAMNDAMLRARLIRLRHHQGPNAAFKEKV